MKDVQPHSLDDIPIGTRVCAYWSQQYRCFYPGLVSEGKFSHDFWFTRYRVITFPKLFRELWDNSGHFVFFFVGKVKLVWNVSYLVPEDEKIGRNCCWVEFDDGDSGEFPLPDVRMIPPDFPQEGKIFYCALSYHTPKYPWYIVHSLILSYPKNAHSIGWYIYLFFSHTPKYPWYSLVRIVIASRTP